VESIRRWVSGTLSFRLDDAIETQQPPYIEYKDFSSFFPSLRSSVFLQYKQEVVYMFVPFFPLLGMSDHLMLLDPTVVFTPLTCGLVLLASLCGLGIGVLLARTREVPKRIEAHHSAPPSLPKAA
jgi:hypothetical protein